MSLYSAFSLASARVSAVRGEQRDLAGRVDDDPADTVGDGSRDLRTGLRVAVHEIDPAAQPDVLFVEHKGRRSVLVGDLGQRDVTDYDAPAIVVVRLDGHTPG